DVWRLIPLRLSSDCVETVSLFQGLVAVANLFDSFSMRSQQNETLFFDIFEEEQRKLVYEGTFPLQDVSISKIRNAKKIEVFSEREEHWVEVSRNIVELFAKNGIKEVYLQKVIDNDLSYSFTKKLIPFLQKNYSNYVIDYIIAMEQLLEPESGYTVEKEVKHTKELLSKIEISGESDNFNNQITKIIEELVQSKIGRMIVNNWVLSSEGKGLVPTIKEAVDDGSYAMELENQVFLSLDDDVGCHCDYIPAGDTTFPKYVELGHEILHCIHGNLRNENEDLYPKRDARAIQSKLSNAEEEYTILGINKNIYLNQGGNLLPEDCVSEAALFLETGLPTRVSHKCDNTIRPMNIHNKNPGIDKIKEIFYEFIADYTKYAIDITPEKSDDISIVVTSLKRDGLLYEYVADGLKENEELIMAAMMSDIGLYEKSKVYEMLPKKIKENTDLMIKVLRREPLLFSDIDPSHKDYYKLAVAALHAGHSYDNFPDAIQNLYEFKIEAVRNPYNIFNIKLMDPKDLADPKLALEAVIYDDKAYDFIAIDLRNVREFLMKGVSRNAHLLNRIFRFNPELKKDRQLILAAAHDKKVEFYMGPRELLVDKSFLIEMASIHPLLTLKSIPSSLVLDREFAQNLVNTIREVEPGFNFRRKGLKWFVTRMKYLDIDLFTSGRS
ncbi:MAG: hypothetical protein AAGG81_00305, partial [Chlamydiota bacterium]